MRQRTLSTPGTLTHGSTLGILGGCGALAVRQTGATLADSYVQYFTPKAPEKRKLSYTEIARLEFSGKDRAAGKHWEDWVKAYNERKAAGETNIGLHPESLE